MKEVSSVARIVTNRRQKILPLLDFTAKAARGKEVQLLSLLQTKDSLTNIQATKELYGGNSGAHQTALRKLKSRLQHKLLNHLFFLDHTDTRHPVYRQYEQECLDLVYQAGVLLREGEYTMSEKLYSKSLRLTVEGEFTTHQVTALHGLRQIYAEQRQTVKFKAVCAQLRKAEQLLQIEYDAGHLFWEAKMLMAEQVRVRQTLLQKLPDLIAKMEGYYRQNSTFRIYDYLYKLRLMQQELVGDYEGVIRTTASSEKLYQQGKLNAKRFDRRYNMYYSVYAYFQARRVHQGLKLAQEYLNAFHRSSGNWFVFLELYLMLAMHAGDYRHANELLSMAFQNPFYAQLRDSAHQRWELYRAYHHFIDPENSPLRGLHFTQFMQTLPDYSRDKQGLNVAILILQFLHYLRLRDVEALLPRLEGLRKYASNHLRNPAAQRTRLFFRLLQLTVKENFDVRASTRKGQVLLTRLEQTPMPGEAFAGVEIIPYENLWQQTLQILQLPSEGR